MTFLHIQIDVSLTSYWSNSKGWSYRESEDDKCCGECKQAFCVFEDTLYPPGTTWSSDDNCTTYTCMEKDGQVSSFLGKINIFILVGCVFQKFEYIISFSEIRHIISII